MPEHLKDQISQRHGCGVAACDDDIARLSGQYIIREWLLRAIFWEHLREECLVASFWRFFSVLDCYSARFRHAIDHAHRAGVNTWQRNILDKMPNPRHFQFEADDNHGHFDVVNQLWLL